MMTIWVIIIMVLNNCEIQHPIQLIYCCAIEEKYLHCLYKAMRIYIKPAVFVTA